MLPSEISQYEERSVALKLWLLNRRKPQPRLRWASREIKPPLQPALNEVKPCLSRTAPRASRVAVLLLLLTRLEWQNLYTGCFILRFQQVRSSNPFPGNSPRLPAASRRAAPLSRPGKPRASRTRQSFTRTAPISARSRPGGGGRTLRGRSHAQAQMGLPTRPRPLTRRAHRAGTRSVAASAAGDWWERAAARRTRRRRRPYREETASSWPHRGPTGCRTPAKPRPGLLVRMRTSPPPPPPSLLPRPRSSCVIAARRSVREEGGARGKRGGATDDWRPRERRRGRASARRGEVRGERSRGGARRWCNGFVRRALRSLRVARPLAAPGRRGPRGPRRTWPGPPAAQRVSEGRAGSDGGPGPAVLPWSRAPLGLGPRTRRGCGPEAAQGLRRPWGARAAFWGCPRHRGGRGSGWLGGRGGRRVVLLRGKGLETARSAWEASSLWGCAWQNGGAVSVRVPRCLVPRSGGGGSCPRDRKAWSLLGAVPRPVARWHSAALRTRRNAGRRFAALLRAARSRGARRSAFLWPTCGPGCLFDPLY